MAVLPYYNECLVWCAHMSTVLSSETQVSMLWQENIIPMTCKVVQNKTRELLTESGVDVEQISRTASSAEKQLQGPVSAATPTFTKVWNFLTTADPQTLGKTALAVIAAYILTPVAVRGVFSSFRGYSGAFSPASGTTQALPLINYECKFMFSCHGDWHQ